MAIPDTPIRGGRRRLESRAGDENGQVLALFVVSIVFVLGMVALAIDVGHAYYVKRSLQASADAAATAAALELPDGAAAKSRAVQYGSGGGGKNESPLIPDVTTSTTLRCLAAAPCNPVNAITVRESTTVQTFFARVVGLGSFDISARATACSPCGARPLDVIVIIDRSSSMCTTSDGRPDPACTDMNNARDGARAFLQVMDPAVDLVGLAVFPPVSSMANVCERPTRPVQLEGLAVHHRPTQKDYLLNGALNPSSTLVRNLTCMHYGIGTSYATAIEQAQAELDAHGRPDADDVIVMLTDGAANRGPTYTRPRRTTGRVPASRASTRPRPPRRREPRSTRSGTTSTRTVTRTATSRRSSRPSRRSRRSRRTASTSTTSLWRASSSASSRTSQ